jgi:hypothetical protein
MMPGMNGHELAQWVAMNRPKTQTALMTGYDADVVDGADVGVVQRRRGPGLALESFERSLIPKFIRHGFFGNYLLTREALLRRIIHKPGSANPASAADPGSGVRKARISPPGFCVVWMLR